MENYDDLLVLIERYPAAAARCGLRVQDTMVHVRDALVEEGSFRPAPTYAEVLGHVQCAAIEERCVVQDWTSAAEGSALYWDGVRKCVVGDGIEVGYRWSLLHPGELVSRITSDVTYGSYIEACLSGIEYRVTGRFTLPRS